MCGLSSGRLSAELRSLGDFAELSSDGTSFLKIGAFSKTRPVD